MSVGGVSLEKGRPGSTSLKECSRWLPEIRQLWREVGKALGWKRVRWKSFSLLFKEEKATEAVPSSDTRK
jgi:hypothetical protein